MSEPKKPKPCKNAGDDKLHAKRPTVPGAPGPRCATCLREHKRAVSLRARERRTEANFNLTPKARALILAAQGGMCPICQRAREASAFRKGGKRLAHDHDHKCCPGKTSCGRCLRGLVCGRCNDLLAHCRDDVDMLLRAVAYLRRPPAQTALLALDDDEEVAS